MTSNTPGGDSTISNRAIYESIKEQIIPELAGIREQVIRIREQVVRINGDVGNLKDRQSSTSQRLGEIDRLCNVRGQEITRLQEAERFRGEQMRDTSDRQGILENRVVQLMVEVAKWGAVGLGVSGGIAKLIEVIAESAR